MLDRILICGYALDSIKTENKSIHVKMNWIDLLQISKLTDKKMLKKDEINYHKVNEHQIKKFWKPVDPTYTMSNLVCSRIRLIWIICI